MMKYLPEGLSKANSTAKKAAYSRQLRIGKKTALAACLLVAGILLCTLIPLGAASTNFGVTSIGSQNYPTTNVGVTAPDNGGVAANYLVADVYTTSVPLTVYQISSYGQATGNVEIAIYTDNGGVPGNLISGTAASGSVTSGAWSTFAISNTYLPAGTYWIVFDIDTPNAITSISGSYSGTGRIYQQYAYTNGLPTTAPGGWSDSQTPYDCTYFSGYQIEGYAMATQVSLTADNAALQSLSFYSYTTGNFRLAIYSDNSGPATKLWESPDTAAVADSWNTVQISQGTPAALTLSSNTYWLVWQWNSPNSGPSYSSGSSGSGQYLQMAYGQFPATWSSGTSTSQNWSIYATYGALSPAPENALGSVIAIAACIGAFAVFQKRRKTN